MTEARDHGGGLDQAMAHFGGARADWIDLSTGINPSPYPLPVISPSSWSALPDRSAFARLKDAARCFWDVPGQYDIVPAGGASALIAALPRILEGGSVSIPQPTYNEHRAAFKASGWAEARPPDVTVVVHPNNPDGRLWDGPFDTRSGQIIVDESFCDVLPERSFLRHYSINGVELKKSTKSYVNDKFDGTPPIILKSFGKFWGLAGVRLGFAICAPSVGANLREALGPWQVSGPACEIGINALSNPRWATETRARLKAAAQRLDNLLDTAGLDLVGGTDLFRLVAADDAQALQTHLAKRHILTRIFPYSKTWVRFGLPGPQTHWDRLTQAMNDRP